MTGSIERLRRRIQLRSFAPLMLLVIGAPMRPDPIAKRASRTAGVLPIPGPSAAAPMAVPHGELMLPEGRRDTRAERGRVLYAPGHAPRDTAAVRTLRKHPCPDERAVQSHAGT